MRYFTASVGFLLTLINVVTSQYLGSSLYGAMSGYGANDMCRYISCPFGQYCINGNCISSTSALAGGGLGGMGMGGMGMGGMGAMGGMGGMGGVSALANAASLYSGRASPYAMYGGYGSALGNPALSATAGGYSGIQPCNLMQQCLNGQICVNGYCETSNVAYAGSQVQPKQTTCMTGAVCPVGQYCMGGVCMQNPMSTTFACHNGISCPMGMMCTLGRCIANGLPFMGKK